MKGEMNVYLDGFTSIDDVIREFGGYNEADQEALREKLKSYEVVVACYDQECYSGDAFVLLKKDGEYFEANGSHCSCSGLEGQMDIEESPKEALKRRFVGNTGLYGAQTQAAHVVRRHFGWDKETTD